MSGGWLISFVVFACSVVFPLGAVAQDVEQWSRDGFIWQPLVEQEPIIDQKRVSSQIAEGCGSSHIRFGDTASMRGYDTGIEWPELVRRLSVAASTVDNYEIADAYLSQARNLADLDRRLLHVLENLAVLTALQFGETAAARALLAQIGLDESLAPPVLSDRLFWSVVVRGETASSQSWSSELLPQLDRAMAADPSSFQVRVWRVLGWLSAYQWENQSCTQSVGDFSTIVLDVADAGACPILVAHFSHQADRYFGPLKHRNSNHDLFAWKLFGDGILAHIAGNGEHLEATISQISNFPQACSQLMIRELTSLRGGP